MKGDDTTVREEVRDFETGWIPWVLAAAYFPVYIVLDFAVGDAVAARLGLPQSVAVGLVSLSISAVVVLLFVLVNVGKALQRSGHPMGGSSPARRGARRVLSVPVRAVRAVVGATGAAVLAVFVAATDGVALLLGGIWSAVAAAGRVVYLALSLLLRPFVLLAGRLASPFVAAGSAVGGPGGGDADATDGELAEPAARPELQEAVDPIAPLRRPDGSGAGTDTVVDADAGTGPSSHHAPGREDADDPSDTARGGPDDETGGELTVDGDDGADDADPRPEADLAADVGPPGDSGEGVVPGDSSGVTREADDPAPGTDRAEDPAGRGERSGEWVTVDERSVDDPDEEEWPDDWISASDV